MACFNRMLLNRRRGRNFRLLRTLWPPCRKNFSSQIRRSDRIRSDGTKRLKFLMKLIRLQSRMDQRAKVSFLMMNLLEFLLGRYGFYMINFFFVNVDLFFFFIKSQQKKIVFRSKNFFMFSCCLVNFRFFLQKIFLVRKIE